MENVVNTQQDWLQTWLVDVGVAENSAEGLSTIILMIGIALLSVIANYITKKVVLKFITFYINNNKIKWDNYMLERKVFHRLSHIVHAIIIYLSTYLFTEYASLIEKGVTIYLIVVILLVINSFLNAIHDYYITLEISKTRPIRGYIQVAKIILFIMGGILLLSSLFGVSPLILLSGLGALSAVTMLVFKDSILGLTAGVQLTTNDMVRVGDWIEMTKYGADGDVIDISLNTVKVQNWDKTITSIPTYALISDSFKNWRGMQTSGGRRIKRSINIDTSSITFCTPEMLERFKKIHYLREYIETKEQEIEAYNTEHNVDRSVKVNGRGLTNIGILRVYIQQYIEKHPKIHKGMTCMVRQLQPEESGLPLEIYAFANSTAWAIYEGIQSDIFDHIFAVAPEFGLRIFQKPTGYDLKSGLQQEDAEKEFG